MVRKFKVELDKMTKIQLTANVMFDLEKPDFSGEDILLSVVQAASSVYRFKNQLAVRYNIIAHMMGCAYVASFVDEKDLGDTLKLQLVQGALLHDIGESFYGDIPGPFKHLVGTEYEKLEHLLRDAVASNCLISHKRKSPEGNILSLFDHPIIKAIDLLMCVYEWRGLSESMQDIDNWGNSLMEKAYSLYPNTINLIPHAVTFVRNYYIECNRGGAHRVIEDAMNNQYMAILMNSKSSPSVWHEVTPNRLLMSIPAKPFDGSAIDGNAVIKGA